MFRSILNKTITIILIILFIPSISLSGTFEGYKWATWGMTLEEVEKIANRMGLHIEKKLKYILVINDTAFGYESKAWYLFTPVSSELYGVKVIISSTAPYEELKNLITKKHKLPMRSEDKILKRDVWLLPGRLETKLGIMLVEKINEIEIVYTSPELTQKAQKEGIKRRY